MSDLYNLFPKDCHKNDDAIQQYLRILHYSNLLNLCTQNLRPLQLYFLYRKDGLNDDNC